MAERGGFEPPIPYGIHAFQACALGHYATSPDVQIDFLDLQVSWEPNISFNTSCFFYSYRISKAEWFYEKADSLQILDQ